MTEPFAAFSWLDPASITAPLGWTAGAVEAGIKTYGETPRYDLGVLASDRPCAVAGVFTQNRVVGAPVTISRDKVQSGRAQAIVVNSGCSNVAMGEQGLADARRMCRLAAENLGIDEALVLVASTGVIARPLPMARIENGIASLTVRTDGGPDFARAIMTTDTVPKCRAVRFAIDGVEYTAAGTAKGSGMAHPNLATVLCFLTVDANVPSAWLQPALARIADDSVNMVDVDMDTSTSDMMIAFANGAAGGPDLSSSPAALETVERALLAVSTELAKDLARDGEGATKLIEAKVAGAKTQQEARGAARTIVSSPLVKSMVTGADPNLGRILMALGRSGAELDLSTLRVFIGPHLAFESGTRTALDLSTISEMMRGDTVEFRVELGLGTGSATAWGCNLTEGYVRINADYTT